LVTPSRGHIGRLGLEIRTCRGPSGPATSTITASAATARPYGSQPLPGHSGAPQPGVNA
jgi:hypothetical protein